MERVSKHSCSVALWVKFIITNKDTGGKEGDFFFDNFLFKEIELLLCWNLSSAMRWVHSFFLNDI